METLGLVAKSLSGRSKVFWIIFHQEKEIMWVEKMMHSGHVKSKKKEQ